MSHCACGEKTSSVDCSYEKLFSTTWLLAECGVHRQFLTHLPRCASLLCVRFLFYFFSWFKIQWFKVSIGFPSMWVFSFYWFSYGQVGFSSFLPNWEISMDPIFTLFGNWAISYGCQQIRKEAFCFSFSTLITKARRGLHINHKYIINNSIINCQETFPNYLQSTNILVILLPNEESFANSKWDWVSSNPIQSNHKTIKLFMACKSIYNLLYNVQIPLCD